MVSNAGHGMYNGGSALIDYNDVWDNGFSNDPGPNGISADPLFTDAAAGDYTLHGLSPCIDAGDPASPPDPDETRADMGALPGTMVEFVRGDANYSGTVDAADIIYLVDYVYRSGPSPQPVWHSGDTNCDGTINPIDVVYLVNYVFKSGPEPACP